MLQYRGAQGKCVLLLYPPGLAFIVGVWGCFYAGAVAVLAPLPTSGLQSEPHRIDDIINDSKTSFVLTVENIERQLVESLTKIPRLASVNVIASDAVDP